MPSLVFTVRFLVLMSINDGASGLIDFRVERFCLLPGDLVELMSLTERECTYSYSDFCYKTSTGINFDMSY